MVADATALESAVLTQPSPSAKPTQATATVGRLLASYLGRGVPEARQQQGQGVDDVRLKQLAQHVGQALKRQQRALRGSSRLGWGVTGQVRL